MDIILKYFTDFTPLQLEQVKALEPLYRHWNERINVISRKDMDGLYEKHVLHSLSIAAVFDFATGTEIIDIGTGGGFPGIPLAIFFPNSNFLLADSVGKKLKVVEAVAGEIGLKNVTTKHTRAEEIKGRKFDFAVSRAVAPLADLWKWSKPLLKSKGREPVLENDEPGSSSATAKKTGQSTYNPGLICLKGGDLAGEIQASGTRPYITNIEALFPEPTFKEKFLLYVPAK